MLDDLYNQGRSASILALQIDEELNRRADAYTEKLAKIATEAKKKALAQLKIREDFEALTQGTSKRVLIKAAIQEFGGDFEGDYTINMEALTIESHCSVAKYNYHGQVWQHPNEEVLIKHYNDLLYWRIYNAHFRTEPSADSLTRLQSAMTQLLKEA